MVHTIQVLILYSPALVYKNNTKTMKIYDNGGKTFDRYTVIYDSGDVIGLSLNPESPQGFSQYCGVLAEKGGMIVDGPHLGKVIAFEELPENIQEHIKARA